MESAILENLDCGIWNPGFWLEESGIPLTIEFQNPSSTDCNPVPQESTGTPRRGIQNPRLCWIPLHEANCRLPALLPDSKP